VHICQGFLLIPHEENGYDTDAFFQNIADPLMIGATSLYVVQTAIGDAVLVRPYLFIVSMQRLSPPYSLAVEILRNIRDSEIRLLFLGHNMGDDRR
jgi:hypothetical protein